MISKVKGRPKNRTVPKIYKLDSYQSIRGWILLLVALLRLPSLKCRTGAVPSLTKQVCAAYICRMSKTPSISMFILSLQLHFSTSSRLTAQLFRIVRNGRRYQSEIIPDSSIVYSSLLFLDRNDRVVGLENRCNSSTNKAFHRS